MEIEMEPESSNQLCAVTIMHIAEVLITQWTNKRVIGGIYAIDRILMNNNYDDLDR